MKKYKQLDQEQRYKLEALLSAGHKKADIAEQLGVHRSTIYRELHRNSRPNGDYNAEKADQSAKKREQTKNKAVRFTIDQYIYFRDKLIEEQWSPEYMSKRGRQELGSFVSHEWLYQYIWAAKKSRSKEYKEDRELHKYLKHHGRRKKRKNQKDNRGCLPNRVSIEERPPVVDKRIRYGDYEVDFMMSKGNKPGLIVLTDRATLMTHMIKMKTKQACVVAEQIIKRLRKEKKDLKTLTFDNDTGFAKHEQIAFKLAVETYFTHPYSSWEKGTVENRIGVIRRFFHKGTDMSTVHPNTIKSVERKLNNRPVRKFNYATPIEKCSELVKAA